MILAFDHGAVRELRLNRRPVNALTGELMVALRQAIEAAPQQGVRALILSGTPGRFSGGLDVPLLLTLERPAIAAVWRELYALLKALAASPIPIAAAVTGHSPAGGTVLALFCDFRVMAQGDSRSDSTRCKLGFRCPLLFCLDSGDWWARVRRSAWLSAV